MWLKKINYFFKKGYLSLPGIRQLVRWSRTHSVPGFEGVTIYHIVVFVLRELKKDRLSTRANAIAFSFFLSLIPAIIVLFTLIPYILPLVLDKGLLQILPGGQVDFNQTLITQLQQVMPDPIENEMISFIQDISTRPRVGLLSIGFILVIFFSSNGMMTMMMGFEKSYADTFRKRTPLKMRLVAIFLTLMLGGIVVASVLLSILGTQIIDWIKAKWDVPFLSSVGFTFLRYAALLFVYFLGIGFLYRYGAATVKRFPWFSPGTNFAAIGIILTSLGFSFYVDNFGNYNRLYGSLASIIVTLLYIQINARVLLIGFELNAAIAVNRNQMLRELENDQQEEEDVDNPSVDVNVRENGARY